jgi:hypothetical protein
MPCRTEPCCCGREDCSECNGGITANDRATRAACDMRTIIRKFAPKLEAELTPETRKWIHKHDIEDARRIAEETAARIRDNTRLRALEKLSLEERRVLGL